MKRPELLAPAGNIEKMKTAFNYGADAVYLGGKFWGLRAQGNNFTMDEICEAVEYAHKSNKKIYVTTNIIAHNSDIDNFYKYVENLISVGIDALIVSDIGIFSIIREIDGEIPIHISTQANVTNWKAASIYQKMGASRIILARELSHNEISEFLEKLPDMEFEIFVHGAMCISYSGRCLLSSYLTHRDANRGNCSQPCRWRYYLVEEHRLNEPMEIIEENGLTTIMNSKDLSLLKAVPELMKLNLSSWKIEGRMKSINYVATVTKVYRTAIDSYLENPNKFVVKNEWLNELDKVSNRAYTTGFFYGNPMNDGQNYQLNSYKRDYKIIGIVKQIVDKNLALVEIRNKLIKGEPVEFVLPKIYNNKILEANIFDITNKAIDFASPNQIIYMKTPNGVQNGTIIRKKIH